MEPAEAGGNDVTSAEGLWLAGDWDGAAAAFEQMLIEAGPSGLAPRFAWQYGAVLYLQGETAQALTLLSAVHNPEGITADDALVSAWLGAVLWRSGQVDDAEKLAAQARRCAIASRDQQAIAAAEVTNALVYASRGDRIANVRSYRAALRAAEAAGDVIQTGRILANLASKALEDGDFARAVADADRSIAIAEAHRPIVGLALENKAAALIRLGRLDLARAAAAGAVEAYATAGSGDVAAPEFLLGEVYRLRGDAVQARLAFERALLSAASVQDTHQAAAACAGLAWVLVGSDPEAAVAFADRAIEHASRLERPAALNARAWVSLANGDPVGAAALAVEAEAAAQAAHDRWSLATALEIRAVSGDCVDINLLGAALAIWMEIEDPIATARARLAVAVVTADRALAAKARAELAELVAAEDVGVTGMIVAADQKSSVLVTMLGRFSVTVAGAAVPRGAWQSRLARELLKLLVARSGRPATREALAEELWAGEPYSSTGPRLSVLLTRLRTILDPDRRHPADQYLDADATKVALRTDRVQVDVVDFLIASSDGARLVREGRRDEAELLLRAAEQLFVGDLVCEEDDAEWVLECRDQARASAVTCARLLARIAADRGDDEDVAHWLVRLLERDPYDEDAWVALISAHTRLRRHGEAAHHHATYSRRMRELDLPAEPFEKITHL